MSDAEKTRQWEKQDDSVIPTKWTQIKNISQKRALQEIFITSTVKKYKLNNKEQDQLEHTINLGFTLQAFSDIKLSPTGKIAEFVGLHFDPVKREFYFIKPKLKIKKTKINVDMELNDHLPDDTFFSKQWIKFINYITKSDKTLQANIYEHLSSSVTLSTPIVICDMRAA
jgi:hypothetical protein